MKRKFIIYLGLVFLFTGCNFLKEPQFDLEKLIKSRPSKKEYVFDYAHLLKYTKENMEEHLKYFKEKYGIEMLIVTIPSLEGKSINEVASRMFTSWNIGRDNQSKGILLLLSDKEKLIKVEVGYGVEDIFTDLFCGYIERKQLKPYFENNQVDEGLSATLEEFIARVEGKLTDKEIKRRIKGYLSGGAGIKKKIKIGEYTRKETLSPVEKAYYSAGSTPQETFKRYIEHLKNYINDPDLGIYTQESRIFYRYIPKLSKSYFDSRVRQLNRLKYHITTKGNYAVVLFEGKGFRKEGPYFLKKTEEGWQIDIISMSKWVRYDTDNNWFIGGDNHPYIFAFENNQYSKYVWDYDFYDDFGKFSQINCNYDYCINLYKKRLQESPNDFQTIISLAEIFFDLCIPKEAVPLLQKAIQLNPNDARPYRYLGLINRDNFCAEKTAIKYLKKYIELAPNDPDGYHYISVAYWRMASWQNKLSYYDKAIYYMKKYGELSGDRIYSYNMIGYFYYLKGDYFNAKRWFKNTLRLNPTNEYAKKMLEEIK